MKTKISLFLLLLCIGIINAQETITTAGGEASGVGGTLSESFGQTVYTTNQSSDGSIAQGVQQAFEISVVLGVSVTNIQLNISVYPNPTTNYLTLKIVDGHWDALNYQLYDTQGRLVKSNKALTESTVITMQNLATGSYFLKVTQNQHVLKTFKIIKN